jgi:hypothetical protein
MPCRWGIKRGSILNMKTLYSSIVITALLALLAAPALAEAPVVKVSRTMKTTAEQRAFAEFVSANIRATLAGEQYVLPRARDEQTNATPSR